MASIPELLDGHVTLEVECLDRLYLNGYIGPLATSGGLVTFMREQLGKPIPSPVVLGQVTEKFREGVKTMAERERIPLYPFDHKERKDDVANDFRRQRGIRDGVVFVGVAQEKAQAFQGKKIALLSALWTAFFASFRSRTALQLEILALRHQLGVLQRSVKRPKLATADRLLWAWLCAVWNDWRSGVFIVKASTVIGWHWEGFRPSGPGRSDTVSGGGRPCLKRCAP
jgi:hypothetical protein